MDPGPVDPRVLHDLSAMDPGPIDPSVLTSQDTHRSTDVWRGEVSRVLTCQCQTAPLNRMGRPHPRIIPYLQQSGFYGMSCIEYIQLDWQLITALVERWRPETHTFHIPSGEITITLQDVAIQLGLPIDGRPVTGITNINWHIVCRKLLGIEPVDQQLKDECLNLTWLATTFAVLPDDADEVTIQRYARAYILQLLGGLLFVDKSQSFVHAMFLPLLEDFTVAGQYSWGSAALAWLYRNMCHAAESHANVIAGPLILLQLWAQDRFPHIAQHRLFRHHSDVGVDAIGQPHLPSPLGIRWQDEFTVMEASTDMLQTYRCKLDRQTPDQVVWQPYSDDVIAGLPKYCLAGQDIWRTVSPLICFHIVELHRPDRVLRQFGLQQGIPVACDTRVDLHEIYLCGGTVINWATRMRKFIVLWNRRRKHIATGRLAPSAMAYDDPYMQWYRRITLRFVGRKGALCDMMSESMDKICRLSGQNSEAYSLARYALQALDGVINS